MHSIKMAAALLLAGLSYPSFSQDTTIKGIVVDEETQHPLMGANVCIDSSTYHSTTNANGEFSLRVSTRKIASLTFSFTGYQQLTYYISDLNTFRMRVFEMKQKVNNLDEVVVTGTGTPHYKKNAPVETEVYTQKAVEIASSSTIEGVLSRLSPSFSISTNAMGTFLKLNGLGNDYFIVMINGKRVYGDVGSQNDLSRIDPSTVERVELVKGASSSLYGSDAIAGVVNIITKKNNAPLSFNSTTRLGSYGEINQNISLGCNSKEWSSLSTLGYSKSDGWKNTSLEIDKNSTPDNPNDDKLVKSYTMTKNPSESKTLKERLSKRFSERLSASADADITYREVTPPVMAKGYDFLYHNQSYAAGISYLFKTNGSISADATYDRFRYLYRYEMKYNTTYKGNDGETRFVTYYPNDISLNNDQQRLALNIKLSYKPNTRNNVVLGSESVVEWMRSPFRLRTSSVDDNEHSLFIQDELDIIPSILTVTAGARLVHHSNFGEKITPKASLLYHIGSVNFRGTIAKGYKTPTLKELYYRYERDDMGAYRVYLGNQKLRPQLSTYISAAVEYNSEILTLSVSPYINRVFDMIEYKAVETSQEDKDRGVEETKQYGNIRNASIAGVDINASVKLTRTLLVGGGYSYTDAQNTTDNCRLKDVALHHSNVRCEWNRRWKRYSLTVGVVGELSSKQYGDALSENYYDRLSASGYSLWKVSTTHRLKLFKTISTDFSVGVDNIFGYRETKPYGMSYGTTTPGRTAYFSVGFKYAKQ